MEQIHYCEQMPSIYEKKRISIKCRSIIIADGYRNMHVPLSQNTIDTSLWTQRKVLTFYCALNLFPSFFILWLETRPFDNHIFIFHVGRVLRINMSKWFLKTKMDNATWNGCCYILVKWVLYFLNSDLHVNTKTINSGYDCTHSSQQSHQPRKTLITTNLQGLQFVNTKFDDASYFHRRFLELTAFSQEILNGLTSLLLPRPR